MKSLQLPDTATNDLPLSNRTCWSAILMGAFVGLGLGFLLQLYGVAIGLSAYHASLDGAITIAIGGFLGLLVGTVFSMGSAGFISGYLVGHAHREPRAGVLYGFLTWTVSLLLTAILVLPLSNYISTYTETLKPNTSVANAISQNMEAKSNAAGESTKANVQANKVTSKALMGSAWMVFLLFAVGAFSSCVGACCGISCKNECMITPKKNRSSHNKEIN